MAPSSSAFLAVVAVLFVAVAFVAIEAPVAYAGAYDRPIIGILAQPCVDDKQRWGASYIAASYVKWIESAGAQVVPIPFNSSAAVLKSYVDRLNGILLPGGGVDLQNSYYYTAEKILFNLVVDANNAGTYLPLWATCLGFESIGVIASGDDFSVLQDGFDSYHLPLPLQFTSDFKSSRLFRDAPDNIINILGNQPVTLNNHHAGITTTTFSNNSKLKSFYRLMSTNFDRVGKQFISTIESFKYPIYGVQYHPEKNSFEWDNRENLPHSWEAIQVTQYFANFFVNEARKNGHHFASDTEEAKYMIYNFAPIFTGLLDQSDFLQCYFFPN